MSSVAMSIARRLVFLTTWIPLGIFVQNNVVDVFPIHGPSMYPLFNTDRDTTTRRDWALCYKSWGFPQYGLERGMVVAFRCPHDPNKTSIKRITATEGEPVMTRDNKLKVVPEAHIWVEGDASDDRQTRDSHIDGPISVRLVEGRLTHILYPFHKFGKIPSMVGRIKTPTGSSQRGSE